MISLMHFDKERSLGVLQNNGRLFIAFPPYSSINETGKKFKLGKPIKKFKSLKEAKLGLLNEFNTNVVNNGAELVSRMNNGTSATVDKVRAQIVRTLEREFGQNRIMENDIRDLKSFHLMFGFGTNHLNNIKRLLKLANPELAKKLDYHLDQDSGIWKDNVSELIEYAQNNLLPEKRFEEASKLLMSIKMHQPDISETNNKDMDRLILITRNSLMAQARERGESFAKPWQKYANPEFGLNKKMPGDNQKNE